jgi:radical SAM protein with 4Fe4S-binding SPASM domain
VLNVSALLARPERARPRAVRAPVVVWSCTSQCNLACLHCYSDSSRRRRPELTTREALVMLDDLAALGCPALVVSGGEPLMRRDLLDLIGEARARGLRVVLSTNATLVTRPLARRLARLGVARVSVGLDGTGSVHSAFRGRRVAFDRALRGIRLLRDEGLPLGVGMTLAHSPLSRLSSFLELVRDEGVSRACFQHLVPAGRGRTRPAVAPGTVRRALEEIFEWAEHGAPCEVLTAGNPADAAALVLWLRRRDPARADRVERALASGGAGDGAGRSLVAVGWDGRVRPDQFWDGPDLGSVLERPLSRTWADPPPRLVALRGRPERLSGRCAGCGLRAVCGGGLASRALAAGDLDGPDPACHLTDAETASLAA